MVKAAGFDQIIEQQAKEQAQGKEQAKGATDSS